MNRLVDEGKIVIEVGLNESVDARRHPHVACSVDEIVDDAVACAEEGAAVVHFHARNDDGSQAWADDSLYRRAMAGIAARCDAVTYPSYLSDASHVWALVDDPPAGAPLVMASFDVLQEVPTGVQWDEGSRSFVLAAPGGETVVPYRPVLLDDLLAHGLSPAIAIYDVGEARWLGLAHRAGMLTAPVGVKLFLCDEFVAGPAPSGDALDMYLSQLPAELDAECTVVPYTMTDPGSCEQILDEALRRRLHIRVGIGDNPRAFPTATNRELVARAVELVERAGFRPASPADVRRRLDPERAR